jgi:hypothetical protein
MKARKSLPDDANSLKSSGNLVINEKFAYACSCCGEFGKSRSMQNLYYQDVAKGNESLRAGKSSTRRWPRDCGTACRRCPTCDKRVRQQQNERPVCPPRPIALAGQHISCASVDLNKLSCAHRIPNNLKVKTVNVKPP